MSDEPFDAVYGIRVDENMLGPYEVVLKPLGRDGNSSPTGGPDIRLPLSTLGLFIDHLNHVRDSLTERMEEDFLCGDCAKCKNTRMVDVMLPGRTSPAREHCPKCYPKIAKRRAFEGLPDRRQSRVVK